MPVVTRADCTQTNVKESYKFAKTNSSYTASIEKVKLSYQACQGANNNDNDLSAFVQQLVNDGKLSTDEQAIFSKSVVGKNGCPAATTNFLQDNKGLKKDHTVDTTKWTFIVGEGYDDEASILDYRILHEMIAAQEVPIVRRVCPSCSAMTHRDIYYRRLSEIPEDFNLLDTLMNNWFEKDNELNVDFALYSSHLDAYLDTNRWSFCNFNDPNIGFPRDCGPRKKINNQWNSYKRNGGTANKHAFMIPADPSFQSELVHELHPKVNGSAFALQKGLQVSGTIVSNWDTNDYATYASVNFGEAGTTKGIKINYAKGNDGGKIEIRLGGTTSGTTIAEFSPAHTGGWGAYSTAYIGLPDSGVSGLQDLTFVGKGRNGVLNLAYFELSDFADRTVVHTVIRGSEISNNLGVRMGGTVMGHFDKGDFATYSQVNFGAPGETEGIIIRYAKATNGGGMEVRLGDRDGKLLATFLPANTASWGGYVNAYVGIEGVEGIHDLTFVATGIKHGLLNLDSFQLAARNELHPQISATAFSKQAGGVRISASLDHTTHLYGGRSISYDSLNFGSSGDTNSIKITYAKANDGSNVELRLGGPEGDIIGTFAPQRTSGWTDFVTVDVPIDPIAGTHDLTFVEHGNGINLKSFELSDEIFFEVSTDYAVNSNLSASRDIQCTFDVVKTAFIANIYDRYYTDSGKTPNEVFWEHFNANDDEGAKTVVTSLCETAQANMEEM